MGILVHRSHEITEIKVCDDGPGFPDDVKNFLGEPYIRSKNKTINSKSGLGLGTFIGKTLLERMKANVSFATCPSNKGAMVVIQWETKNSNIVGADINELSPIKGFDCYNFLTAKLAYKIISYIFEFKKKLNID